MKLFRNYIFDLGGVIADINPQNALDGFRQLGVPEEELRFDEGETAKIMQSYQLGNLTTDEFCDAIIRRCQTGAVNPTPSRQQVAEAWNSTILHIPYRKMAALRKLKHRANVYLLSNTNELHWQKCLDQWINADGNSERYCFHYTFLSQEMHLEKPDPNIFKRTLYEIALFQSYDAVITSLLDEDNTLFLDDNQDNVNAAISCGISAIHVTPDFDWVHEILGD